MLPSDLPSDNNAKVWMLLNFGITWKGVLRLQMCCKFYPSPISPVCTGKHYFICTTNQKGPVALCFVMLCISIWSKIVLTWGWNRMDSVCTHSLYTVSVGAMVWKFGFRPKSTTCQSHHPCHNVHFKLMGIPGTGTSSSEVIKLEW